MIDRTLAPAISDFTSLSIPPLKSVTLPSGVDVHYLDNREMDVYNIIFLFDSGLLENDGGMSAAARLALPLAGEGSTSHPDGKLSEIMGYHGIRVQTRAHDHHTEYSFGLLRDKLDEALPFIREYIFSPAFSERSIDVYKENAAQSYLLNRQKVNYHSDRAMASHLFGPSHPKAVEVTDSDFRAVKRDKIISAYDRILSSRVSVYMAGVVDDSVLNKINSVFEDYRLSDMSSEYKILPYVGNGLGQRYDIHLDGKLQSSVNISLPAVPRVHPDYLMLRNLIIVLGGYFGSRLVSKIREEKGLTYGISSALYGSPEGAYISIGSMTANENVDELISETEKEIERLSSDVMGDEEFMMVRSYILSQLASMLDTPLNILQYYLSLKTAFIPHSDYFMRQFDTVKTMTPESLRDIATRHLLGRNWTTVVAGDV